jgi:hypothetical protein
MVMIIYLIGCFVAFLLVLLVRCDRSEKFRIDEIRLSDIIAALICCTLSWFVVLFMIFAFFVMIGWLIWEKSKEIVIFKKKGS